MTPMQSPAPSPDDCQVTPSSCVRQVYPCPELAKFQTGLLPPGAVDWSTNQYFFPARSCGLAVLTTECCTGFHPLACVAIVQVSSA
ncbi:MAG: hypothetical protein RLZZ217_2177 [Planctomycetota bacterium]